MKKIIEDDYCDIYEKKICDNCGKCLEEDGIDIKAIKIEDIAKHVEENKILEEEFKSEIEDKVVNNDELHEAELREAYKSFGEDIELNETNEEYEDAFDHLEELDGDSLFDDKNLEDITEEVFPGVRKLKENK